MTVAISIVVLIEAIALIYFGLAILEIRDKMNNVYPEMIEIFNEQRNIIHGILDSMNRWSDLCVDIISHIERVEDMEGDIKDVFEWIHSVDDNIAGMQMDIQETDTKLGDLMAVHDRDILKIKKKISEIKEHFGFEEEDDWNQITVDADNHGDTDGDIQIIQEHIIKIEKDIMEINEKLNPGEYNWDDWNKLITDNMQLVANVTEKQFQDYRTRVAEAVKAVKLEGDDNA